MMSSPRRVAVAAALAVGLPAVVAVVAPAVKARRAEDALSSGEFDPREVRSYDLDQPGLDVRIIRRGDVAGLHLVPDQIARSGVVVTFGGSEGSPDFETALRIAQDGYEVFAMFFFGQEGQQVELVGVPLERWSRIRAVVTSEAADASVLTVVASSKGAEFALCAASHYDDIDHLVLFAPSAYRYPGLTEHRTESGRSSWTLNGRELPCIPFSTKQIRALRWFVPFLTRQLLGRPAKYEPVYAGALSCATPAVRSAARIEVEDYTGDLVLLAGADDRMWPSAAFAKTITEHRPDSTETFLYPAAGHAFGAPATSSGILLGGSAEANEDAASRSHAILHDRLAAWHSRRLAPATPSTEHG